jgi:hypothetical protein
MIKRHYCIRSPIHGCFEHHVIVRIAETVATGTKGALLSHAGVASDCGDHSGSVENKCHNRMIDIARDIAILGPFLSALDAGALLRR